MLPATGPKRLQLNSDVLSVYEKELKKKQRGTPSEQVICYRASEPQTEILYPKRLTLLESRAILQILAGGRDPPNHSHYLVADQDICPNAGISLTF
ncbi:UNVERIFIED_CONTAM: hypothetical protein K2H54_052757 [Gekko kuhli]